MTTSEVPEQHGLLSLPCLATITIWEDPFTGDITDVWYRN